MCISTTLIGMVSLDRPSVDFDAQPPSIRPYSSADFAWAVEVLEATGGRYRVRRGSVVDVALLAGFIAERNGNPGALVTFARPTKEVLEITAIASAPFDDELVHGLIRACIARRQPECRRTYAICSNAHFDVQRALQQVGFTLAAVRPQMIASVATRVNTPISREYGGLVIRDEVEFEMLFTAA